MIEAANLAPLTDDRGRLLVLALDHRDSLRVEFDPESPESVPTADLVRFKRDVVAAFGSRPSAVMLDPELSIEPILTAGLLPDGVGSFCALEAQGYLGDAHNRTNFLLEGWSPARARSVGASAAKLLLLYRPDRGATTTAQEDLVRTVVEDCGTAGIPLFVEPVPYDVADAADRERTVLASAERIGRLQPDVLKMPFPAAAEKTDRWDDACRRLDEVTGRPWAVLSWGAPFETFRRQVEAACANGCSGFMAGRSIWREAVAASDRATELAALAVPRFEALVEASDEARPVAVGAT